jgi:hypothetical protein
MNRRELRNLKSRLLEISEEYGISIENPAKRKIINAKAKRTITNALKKRR